MLPDQWPILRSVWWCGLTGSQNRTYDHPCPKGKLVYINLIMLSYYWVNPARAATMQSTTEP